MKNTDIEVEERVRESVQGRMKLYYDTRDAPALKSFSKWLLEAGYQALRAECAIHYRRAEEAYGIFEDDEDRDDNFNQLAMFGKGADEDAA